MKPEASGDNRRRWVYLSLLSLLIVLPLSIAGYKLFVLDYPLAGLIPAVSYQVDVGMEVDGHGEDVSMRTFLPKSDFRQSVSQEENRSEPFNITVSNQGLNRVAQWDANGVDGSQSVLYSYTVQVKHVRYKIPEGMPIPKKYPKALEGYLKEEPGVQVNDPLIEQTLNRILPPGEPQVLESLTAIHRHLQDQLKNKNFAGFTDALTALKLGEASCNGKGRLFVALARKLGLPSRLVGGVVLEPGVKKISHQWVEVYVNGHWVPFDTINDHFMEAPANFLALYYGDEVLFRHTSRVNFQYFFKMSKRLVPQREAQEVLAGSVWNIFNLYALFERIGISQNLLKIILMIPLGALVVVIFRNVVGLETFGTFLPALIAAASRDAGLLWGMVGFVAIIMISSWVRRGLDWLRLLHSPKMAIMLTAVVFMLLSTTVMGVHAGLIDLAHVSLFPIAILAITAERFALMEVEQGSKKALSILLTTLVVIAFCYWVMDSLFLQSLILAFPELLLVVIAINLWLGKWIGMRLSEMFRFRFLLMGGREA